MKIAAVTGCFDIFHIGHLRLIQFAARFADFVLIGLNSDKSIKLLKGENRPINNENYRKEILESIKYVNKVEIVDSLDMSEFLKKNKPNYWIKGAQYNINGINNLPKNEVEAVSLYGGRILFCPMTEDISTTKIINSK